MRTFDSKTDNQEVNRLLIDLDETVLIQLMRINWPESEGSNVKQEVKSNKGERRSATVDRRSPESLVKESTLHFDCESKNKLVHRNKAWIERAREQLERSRLQDAERQRQIWIQVSFLFKNRNKSRSRRKMEEE
jgi:hypothetical protein